MESNTNINKMAARRSAKCDKFVLFGIGETDILLKYIDGLKKA